MQCVILAGGLATRMRPLTEKVPKSLLPVRGERPFVDYQLEYLKKQGIEKILFCIGYKGEMLRAHLETFSHGLEITYSDEGPQLRGTGGALRLAYDRGLLDSSFFLTYGDSFLPIEFRAVWQDYQLSGASALMTILDNGDRWDQSNVVFKDGQILLYDKKANPKPAQMRFIDYGLSVLSSEVVKDRIPQGQSEDLASVFHQLSLDGKLRGYVVKNRFYEIGSFQGLAEFEQYLSLGN